MDKETKKELHQEFQIERMILFSDAVFAIVITLMAIEMRLPEIEGQYDSEKFFHAILHLFPVIIAYMATFGFIGVIWYQHLKLFSVVKAFNRGLVVRNLLLLFFIGFFPFSASIIARVNSGYTTIPMMIYFFVIVSCMAAQANLQHYVLVKNPLLRNDNDITELLVDLGKKKSGIYSFLCVMVIYLLIYNFFQDSNYKYFASMSFSLIPLFMRFFQPKKSKIN